MNGAELPSGSQLRVEPSQSNYATSKTSTTVEKAADNSLAKEAPAEEKEPDEEPVDEELDDFFSSI